MRKLTSLELHRRLYQNGWALVENQPYTNTTDKHILVCLHCGHEMEKRVKNALRGDRCPECGSNENVSITPEVNRASKAAEEELYIIDSAAMELKFRKAMNRTIAKSAFTALGRKVNWKEWKDISHEVAKKVLERLGSKTIKQQYSSYDVGSMKGTDILVEIIPQTMFTQAMDAVAVVWAKV